MRLEWSLVTQAIDDPHWEVYLHGHRAPWVMADDAIGEVEVPILNRDGRAIYCADGSLLTARLRGPVEIRRKEPWR
jgi:hypothetical protein